MTGEIAVPKLLFAFASDSIGGAERSMLRLMSVAHRRLFDCSLAFCGARNTEFSSAAHSLGIPVHHAGTFGGHRLYQALRKQKPDVLYVFGTIRTLPWAILARMAGIPLVLGSERSTGERSRDHVARLLEIPLFDGYITNSRYGAEALRRKVPRDRIFVVYNGIGADPAPLPPLPDSIRGLGPYVVCVANLYPFKGHVFLLRAIKMLRVRFPTLRAVLVGRDFTSGRFFEAVRKESLEDTFVWTGFVPDVRSIIAAASVFVLPSLVEGMPAAVLEAMLAGLPVIVSDVGGVKELVDEGETGYLVPPGNPAAIAEKLASLFEAPDLGRRMGNKGREKVRNCFGLENMAEGHLHAIRSLLDRKTRRRKHRDGDSCARRRSIP